MQKKISNKPQTSHRKAEILYFLEDGIVTADPWGEGEEEESEQENDGQGEQSEENSAPAFSGDVPSGKETSDGRTVEKDDLPWKSHEQERNRASSPSSNAIPDRKEQNYGFSLDQLALPEETELDGSDLEELSPEENGNDDASGIAGKDVFSVLASAAAASDADGDEGSDDPTQVEDLLDSGEATQGADLSCFTMDESRQATIAAEFDEALNEVCSPDDASHTFSAMPTLRPTPAAPSEHAGASTPAATSASAHGASSASSTSLFQGNSALAAIRSAFPQTGVSSQPHSRSGGLSKPRGDTARPGAGPSSVSSAAQSAHAASASSQKSNPASGRPVPSSGKPTSTSGRPAPGAGSSVHSAHAGHSHQGDSSRQNDDPTAICLLKSDEARHHYMAKLSTLAAGSSFESKQAAAALFAQELYVSGRSAPARKVLEKVADESPDAAYPLAMLGAIALAEGDAEAARASFQGALENDENDLCGLLGMGEICLRDMDASQALRFINAAVREATKENSPLIVRAEAMKGMVEKLLEFLC